MPYRRKEDRARRERERLQKNPEKYQEKVAKNRERMRARRQLEREAVGLPPVLPRALGDPGVPTEKHVVLSRLLRRLLAEAYEKGFLKIDVTHDDTAYELRVRAALDVSKSIEEKPEKLFAVCTYPNSDAPQ